MAVNINLAAGGVVGVTRLSAHNVTADGVAVTLENNAVYAVGGSVNTTYRLPNPGANQDFTGHVIVIKNLGTADLTIGREGTVRIDGGTTDVDLDTTNQVISFYYINATIGWLAGPAVL